MSYKHITALAFGGSGDAETLAFGAALASQHMAVVEVFPIYPDAAVELISYGMALGVAMTQAMSDALEESERESRQRLDADCRLAADRAELAFAPGEGAPRMVLAHRERLPFVEMSTRLALTDLAVIGQSALLQSGLAREALGQVLLQRLAPVLIGRDDPDSLSGAAVIAWDGSLQAGRAVRNALPLLAMASDIVGVQCLAGLDQSSPGPGFAPLEAYLRLHGVGRIRTETVSDGPEGPAILDTARNMGAGLLVAGAYGHSRFRETIFGGATQTFIAHDEGPSLLLAH